MKILAIADEESKYLWDYYDENLFKEVDIILSAGDLKAKYLSFLTTVSHKPVYYVPGNHDYRYEVEPPRGCDCLDDVMFVYNGIRFLGLGGSYRYKKGPYQYTEREMAKRIRHLKVLIHQFGGVDILVTHSPALGHGDGDDLCHKGFDAFNNFIKTYKPSYMIHGHQHLTYSHSIKRIDYVDQTTIINAYNYHLFDYEPNGFTLPKRPWYKRIINTIRFIHKYYRTATYRHYKRYRSRD